MVEFKNISKKYGESNIFEDFSLSLKKGSKTVIMGDSGSGKTTLLRLAMGLERPDSGNISIDGTIAVMFQEPRLLPWRTALENIRAVLKKEHLHLADKYLLAVGLEGDGEKKPRELSGGMAQRVSFARFLAYAEETEADILLLDEPFSALDDGTGEKMLSLLKDFSVGKTVLMVTHDKRDAESFADTIIRL